MFNGSIYNLGCLMHPESAQMIKVKPHRELWGFFNGHNLWMQMLISVKQRKGHPKQKLALADV